MHKPYRLILTGLRNMIGVKFDCSQHSSQTTTLPSSYLYRSRGQTPPIRYADTNTGINTNTNYKSQVVFMTRHAERPATIVATPPCIGMSVD